MGVPLRVVSDEPAPSTRGNGPAALSSAGVMGRPRGGEPHDLPGPEGDAPAETGPSELIYLGTHRVGDALELAGVDGGASIERDLFLASEPG
jgi:hypothetical protein